jgi:hypothetical protein
VVQAGDKVDALDIQLFGMIIVPADNIVFIGVWFFGNTVVHDHDAVFVFNFANVRLGDPPQISRCLLLACKPALCLVMTDFTIE